MIDISYDPSFVFPRFEHKNFQVATEKVPRVWNGEGAKSKEFGEEKLFLKSFIMFNYRSILMFIIVAFVVEILGGGHLELSPGSFTDTNFGNVLHLW